MYAVPICVWCTHSQTFTHNNKHTMHMNIHTQYKHADTEQQTCIVACPYILMTLPLFTGYSCGILLLPTLLRLLESRPKVTGVQAGLGKGLHLYDFSYSREAVFMLTNFCTPKAHVSVSHAWCGMRSLSFFYACS